MYTDIFYRQGFARRLAEVRAEMAAACVRAGRSPEEVTLLAVSKTFPFTAIAEAVAAGQLAFGENYMQDCLPKLDAAAAAGLDLNWHFIGHLQTNKARFLDRRFSLFHCLDSLRLARLLDQQAGAGAYRQRVLVQVNVDDDAAKHGVGAGALVDFLAGLSYMKNLEICGLMTIAALSADEDHTRRSYRRLAALFYAARQEFYLDEPGFCQLSMGMSDDFAIAIEEGATIVRVGSRLFGPRPDFRP
ncbi:MAG: YggS family pyridoxal phosphate-dependent enzyme [Deltaproteobacteria bacterium]|nr:YggS family pyridoxal phosphate-dependent enzyme [Deltaproteobacteria bacterium]